ncbi:MAG: M23 family metallopeptidase [Actinomycetota bacterium]
MFETDRFGELFSSKNRDGSPQPAGVLWLNSSAPGGTQGSARPFGSVQIQERQPQTPDMQKSRLGPPENLIFTGSSHSATFHKGRSLLSDASLNTSSCPLSSPVVLINGAQENDELWVPSNLSADKHFADATVKPSLVHAPNAHERKTGTESDSRSRIVVIEGAVVAHPDEPAPSAPVSLPSAPVNFSLSAPPSSGAKSPQSAAARYRTRAEAKAAWRRQESSKSQGDDVPARSRRKLDVLPERNRRLPQRRIAQVDPYVSRRVAAVAAATAVSLVGIGATFARSTPAESASRDTAGTRAIGNAAAALAVDAAAPRRALIGGNETQALRVAKDLPVLSAPLVQMRAAINQSRLWVSPLASYRYSAGFGERSARWATVHTGDDLAAPTGTPVGSLSSGIVISAGWEGAYGYKVEIRHWDGTVSWYAHLSQIDAGVGQKVQPGQKIGEVGSTGNSSGPHLHLEVHPGGGSAVSPRLWLAERGIRIG